MTRATPGSGPAVQNPITRLAAAVTCAGLLAVATGCGSSGTGPAQHALTGLTPTYLRPDGQVVRADQGGDTVRALAAHWWPLLRSSDRDQALSLRPAGTVLNPVPAVLAMVASAAAAKASGDSAAVGGLLRRATAQQRSHPTYYGAAWDALGSALLRTSEFNVC